MTLLYKTRCPECAKENKDRRGDNLAVYENGSYCFSCGYSSRTYSKPNLLKRKDIDISLPEDITFELPPIATYWLNKYEITEQEIISNHLCYSYAKSYLIFPIWIKNNLEAWQGRYLGDNADHPKWVSRSINNSLYYINHNHNSVSLCCVEDIVSSIKVSRYVDCMPLFNAHLSQQRIAKIFELGYNKLIIWLDPDKRKESLAFAEYAKLYGLEVKVVFSDKDPKECNESFILNQIST